MYLEQKCKNDTMKSWGVGKYILLISFSIFSIKVNAKHVRAAEISAERMSPTQYKFTVILYVDENRVQGGDRVLIENLSLVVSPQKNDDLNDASLNRISLKNVKEEEFVSGETYRTLKVTFEGTKELSGINNTITIGFYHQNRIEKIVNINNGNSISVPLYLETTFFNEGCGGGCQYNRTPQFLVPAVDIAVTNQVFTHNVGAWDADGDSLSYRLIAPKATVGEDVDDYLSPADPSFGAEATLSINPITGDLIWDSPKMTGIYNIAIEVTEWGTSPLGAFKKSTIVRDMQIFVLKSTNKAPIVIAPNDTCVEAGRLFSSVFSGYDPDNNSLTRENYGGPFQTNRQPEVTPYWRNIQRSVLDSAVFEWNPSCSVVRDEPYQVVFKLTDNHPQPLSTLKSWNIRVKLPAPENVQVNELNNNLRISWDAYGCNSTLKKYELYRSSCDTSAFVPDNCTEGVLSEWGFDKIADINKDSLGYLDQTVEVGGEYCYLLLAIDNKGNESLVSEVACGNIGLDLPLLINVSVDATDKVNGAITVKWSRPLDFDTVLFTGPYQYELFRSNDVLGNNFSTTPIETIVVNDFSDSTFSFKDTSLNTLESSYAYRVDFYNNNNKLGSSQTSSYVRINLEAKFKRAVITVDNRVLWQFPDSLEQIVYRVLEDTVIVFDTLYGDLNNQSITNLNNGEEYCFFIETRGVYCNADLVDTFLVNFTNTACIVPDDFNPPCPPILSMDTLDCATLDVATNLNTNTLNWTNNFKIEGCEDDIVQYSLYYQPTLSSAFNQLATLDSLTFDYSHFIENSRAGCYYLTATDLKGLESKRSNLVCNDNCDTIAFPNVITPNGDGKNDFFKPLPTPRNVKDIIFEVYNRLGKLIYATNDNLEIEWGGKNFAGEEVSEGMYYYSAIVTFYRLDAADEQRIFNGWILLQR